MCRSVTFWTGQSKDSTLLPITALIDYFVFFPVSGVNSPLGDVLLEILLLGICDLNPTLKHSFFKL